MGMTKGCVVRRRKREQRNHCVASFLGRRYLDEFRVGLFFLNPPGLIDGPVRKLCNVSLAKQ